MADIAARIESVARIQSSGSAEGARRAGAFAAAARHSIHVRFLRVALLGGAFGAVVLLVGVALFDPFGRLAGSISISGIGVDGTKVTMAHPKLAGFRKDGRPYMVIAQKAVQDALHPTLVELHGIAADITLVDNGLAHMTADTGLYDSSTEHMDVSDNVHVKSPQYTAWLKSASIDFKGGRYISDDPVNVLTSTGTTMAGDAMSAIDNGKELIIEGHVKTMIPPVSPAGEAKAATKDANP